MSAVCVGTHRGQSWAMDPWQLDLWVVMSSRSGCLEVKKSTFRHWAISLATLKFLKMICLIWTISYFIFCKNGEKWHKLNIINIWKATFYFLIYTSFCANHHLILERVYYPVFPRHSLLPHHFDFLGLFWVLRVQHIHACGLLTCSAYAWHHYMSKIQSNTRLYIGATFCLSSRHCRSSFVFTFWQLWNMISLFNNAVKDMDWSVKKIHICYCCVEDPPPAMTPLVPVIGHGHLP